MIEKTDRKYKIEINLKSSKLNKKEVNNIRQEIIQTFDDEKIKLKYDTVK